MVSEASGVKKPEGEPETEKVEETSMGKRKEKRVERKRTFEESGTKPLRQKTYERR